MSVETTGTWVANARAAGSRSEPRKYGGFPVAPVTWLIAAYPLWWVLGLGTLIIQLVAVPMLWFLVRKRWVLTPVGFGFWILFFVWAGLAMLLLGVDPPQTLDAPVLGRLAVSLFRLSQYVALGIILLYIGNVARSELSSRRFAWLLGLLFTYTIAGGLLAVVWPTFEFTSAFEMLLPAGLRADPWIQSMVHPAAAQIHGFLGFDVGRPAAPWGFTNMWGANVALLLPWFVTSWLIRARRRTRELGMLVGAAAVIPIIWSLNRGLWLGLGLVAVLAIGYAIYLGKRRILLPVLLIGALAVPVTLVSPMGELVQDRLENQHSNSIRTFTTVKALDASAYSPIIGYGSTRDSLGSAQSISIGKTPDCPRCGNTPLGQNGQFWLVLISQGIVGLILFYGMFVRGLFKWFWPRSAEHAAGLISLIVGMFMTVYYDMMIASLFVMVLSFAGLWLVTMERYERGSDERA